MQLEHFKRALCVCLALECCLVMDRRAGRWDRQREASSCTHCTSDSLWDLCVECSGCRSRGVGRGRVGRGTQTSPTGLLRLCSRNATTATLSVKLGTDRHIAMLPLLHSSWQVSRALTADPGPLASYPSTVARATDIMAPAESTATHLEHGDDKVGLF